MTGQNRIPGARSSGSSRARVGRPHSGRPVASGRTTPAERDLLAATLGALLRAERVAAGYSTRRLAAAVGCARSTVCRLESGERRPTRVMLAYIASALRPDDHRPLLDALADAAGESLRPNPPGAVRRRRRAAARAFEAGRLPLPSHLERSIALHTLAASTRRTAYALFDRPDALDDPATLDRITALLDEAHRCDDAAGPAVVVQSGGKRWSYGFGL
ncbi:MAG TPA: helix-turn-helix transcriptional regulator [Mycobacteriales bacterium]